MANYSLDDIKNLREQTGMSIADIKAALEKANGDKEIALKNLKERGAQIFEKKAERVALQGIIDTYLHQNRIGVLIEVNSETDFVARNPDFKEFVHNLTLQISSMKPNNVEELLDQEYVKDPSIKVADLLQEMVSKIGEKIVIKRFARYELGE